MTKKNYHAKLLPNQVYHIYNHAIGHEDLFKQVDNYHYFWKQWNKFISPYFANYAFCLMPNHFHVLCKAKPINEMIKQQIQQENTKRAMAFIKDKIPPNVFYESQFRRFFNGYTNAINKQENNRQGSLFKAKFRRTLVSTMEDFIYYVQYIHHNPIHHDFTLNYSDWEHTSYLAYAERKFIKGVSTPPVFQVFKTKEDISGVSGFIKAHEEFRKNFRLDI